MPRQPRIEFPGAYYHVMARGDRREDIVINNQDRELFLQTLEEVCEMTGWEILAWILMPNHYHLALRTPQANLVEGMKWFQNTYTRRFNSRHKLWGHVFGGRYKSILVEEGHYLKVLLDYIHLNPVRAGLAKGCNSRSLLSYRWSSLTQGYLCSPAKRPVWLDASTRLEIEPAKELVSHRRRYLQYLQERSEVEGVRAGIETPEGQGLQSTLQRGWVWGSESFKEQILKKRTKGSYRSVNYLGSPLSKDKHTRQAQDWIREALKAGKLEQSELKNLKASHPAKIAIAIILKTKTTAGNGWIAEQLLMRNAGNVSQLARRYRIGELTLTAEWEDWVQNVKNA